MSRVKSNLRAISRVSDIPCVYRNTPIGLLLEYHNLQRSFKVYQQAKMLVGMCMDNRKFLRIPDNFAFILRTGGANLRYSEFKVSFAIAIGGIRHIALIGHNHCGMENLISKKKDFIAGMVRRAGWSKARAEEHFMNLAPMHEIENGAEFILAETERLRRRYPKVTVAPLFYRLEENRIFCLE